MPVVKKHQQIRLHQGTDHFSDRILLRDLASRNVNCWFGYFHFFVRTFFARINGISDRFTVRVERTA